MPRSAPRRIRAALSCMAVAAALAFMGMPNVTFADARTDYFIRLLTTSDQFRVRAQAALALGRVTPDAAVTNALVGALRDEHPTVRGSALSAIEALRLTSALASVRPLERDSDPTVRQVATRAIRALETAGRATGTGTGTNTTATGTGTQPPPTGNARFYVGIGAPTVTNGSLDAATLTRARETLARAVGGMAGVVIAPAGESPQDMARNTRSRGLLGYNLDPSVTAVEETGTGIRVRVSVTLNTSPGRDLRAMLGGSATVQGAGTSPAARQAALEAALTSAIRGLPGALTAAANRDSAGNR